MIEYENLAKLNHIFFENLKIKFSEVLESGWYILGEQLKNFEVEYAKYIGTRYCVGVASGLDALKISINCLDLNKNAEVLVPSNTYIATILSILHNNLTPVLVEPDIRTYNIDPQKIEEKITKNTRAIIVVHLYGKCCDMNPIIQIAKKHSLAIIEDCAQSHGARYFGKVCGSFGDFGAHSFYPTKNLGALGDGGAITTNMKQYKTKLDALRNYGSIEKYVNEYVGFNSRLDEIQAAFLSIKLAYLDDIINHKRKLAGLYLKYLKNDFIKPNVDDNYYDVYHIFNIRHDKRDLLRSYLMKNEIKTEIHYPLPPHRQRAMKPIIKGIFPVSEEIHATTLSLPISYFHQSDEIFKVIEIMNSF